MVKSPEVCFFMRLIKLVFLALFITGCTSVPFEACNKNSGAVELDGSPNSAYYQAVRRKIYHYVYMNYDDFEQGEVALAFSIFKNGKIADIKVDRAKTNASEILIKAAIKSANDAAPFSKFPEELKEYPYLNFKVILAFEIKECPKFGGYINIDKCPIDNVQLKEVPVIYGKSSLKILKEAEEGKVVLGGCFVGKGNPKVAYLCPICKKVWLRKSN